MNNAGLGCNGIFSEQERVKERSLVDVNVAAVADLTHHYLAKMVARNEGRILCVASMAGFQAGPLMASYFASKAFVVRLVQAIHFELQQQKSNVKIVAFCPGPFASGWRCFWKCSLESISKNTRCKCETDGNGSISMLECKSSGLCSYDHE